MANHELPGVSSSLLGAASRLSTCASRASARALTTTSGATATGAENSSGTNASCVGTVKPNGVSNRTSAAIASSTKQIAVDPTTNPCGGDTRQSPITATAKPAPIS